MDTAHSPSSELSRDEAVEAFKLILADRMAARGPRSAADPEWQSSARLDALRALLPPFDPALGCAAALPSGPGAFVAFATLPAGHAPGELDSALLLANQEPAFLAASETFEESFILYSDRSAAESAAKRMRAAMDAMSGPAKAMSAAARPARGHAMRESSGA